MVALAGTAGSASAQDNPPYGSRRTAFQCQRFDSRALLRRIGSLTEVRHSRMLLAGIQGTLTGPPTHSTWLLRVVVSIVKPR